jgi:hypothetical protein
MTLPLTFDDLMARVRRRIGTGEPREKEDIVVRGRAEHLGSSGTFTWRFGHGSCFVRKVEAATVRTVGADERGVWIHDDGAPARDLEWGEADEARLISAVLAGDWLAPSSGVGIGLLPDGRLRLTLRRREGMLTLDPETFEPRELTIRSSFATRIWVFGDYGRFRTAGRAFPALVEQQLPAGVVNRFVVSSVASEPSDASVFAAPGGATKSRLDPLVAPEVPVERAPAGFLLVQPEIDGRADGRFVFDTGAGANVITPQAAARLGLSSIGSSWLGLAAGASASAVREAGAMRLGPLTIERPAFVEMDLSPISAAGVEIAGILGYDVLRRAIVEIEVAAPRLAILDPAAPPDLGSAWQPIAIYGNHVYVRARFEGHEGWFRLDTGAPQVPVIFNGPAVADFSLLDGRETTRQSIGVPGGTMEVAMGQVQGLELAGHVFDTLPAIFPTESVGAFADRETLGNLGLECLRPFRVIFDYERKRAAFLKRD